jgi:hypothetical protein
MVCNYTGLKRSCSREAGRAFAHGGEQRRRRHGGVNLPGFLESELFGPKRP